MRTSRAPLLLIPPTMSRTMPQNHPARSYRSRRRTSLPSPLHAATEIQRQRSLSI
jgi:hypothetical protein